MANVNVRCQMTNVRSMATDLQDIALLDGHRVKYLRRRSLVQNGDGTKHGYQSGVLFHEATSLLGAFEMQLQ